MRHHEPAGPLSLLRRWAVAAGVAALVLAWPSATWAAAVQPGPPPASSGPPVTEPASTPPPGATLPRPPWPAVRDPGAEPVDALIAVGAEGFTPATAHIPVGGWVQWVNHSDQPHTVSAVGDPFDSHPGCTFADGDPCLRPGESFLLSFPEPGLYRYRSRAVAADGTQWVGLVIVGDVDPDGTIPPDPTAPPGSDVPGAPPSPTTPGDPAAPGGTTTPPGPAAPPQPGGEAAPAPTTPGQPGGEVAPAPTTPGQPGSGGTPAQPATGTCDAPATTTTTTTAGPTTVSPATTTPPTTTPATSGSTPSTTTPATPGSAPPCSPPPPSTSALAPGPAPAPPPTTTPAPGPTPPIPSAPSLWSPVPAASTGWDLGVTPAGDGVVGSATGGFPAHLRAMTDSVVRSGARDTGALVAAVESLEAAGVARDQAIRSVFGRFPVGGMATYTHDWWFPRFGPVWRLHQGVDIFADRGTPVRAPAAGVVAIGNGGLGGLSVKVVEPDGTYWYLAHLAGLADGLVDGAAVAVGDVVGYVGDSGNAAGTPPHLHLEIHPGGGSAIDPKPTMDFFLDEAVAALPGVLDGELAEAEVEVLGVSVEVGQGGHEDHQSSSSEPTTSGLLALVGTPGIDPGGRRTPAPPVTPVPEDPVVVAAALAALAGTLSPGWRRRMGAAMAPRARRRVDVEVAAGSAVADPGSDPYEVDLTG